MNSKSLKRILAAGAITAVLGCTAVPAVSAVANVISAQHGEGNDNLPGDKAKGRAQHGEGNDNLPGDKAKGRAQHGEGNDNLPGDKAKGRG